MVDFHVHSDHSVDAQGSLADLCQHAVSLGLGEIGFADHLDFNPSDSGYGALDPARYAADISRCQQQWEGDLVIRAGVEIGEPHLYQEEVREWLSRHPLDFVIGGVHWVGDSLVGTEQFFACHPDPMLSYLREVRAMVESGAGFHILAHLDFPSRYMGSGWTWDPQVHRNLVEEILEIIIDRKIALEVNTAGYRRGLGRPHPPAVVLGWYRAMGGQLVTLGSDSHRPDDLASGIDEAGGLLLDLGFDQVAGFREGRPYFVPIGSLPRRD